jgi:hypothetical protein
MHTSIDNLKIPIHVDTHGNLYMEVNENLMQLNIDSNDKPYFDTGDYQIISNEIKTMKGKIVNTNKFVDDTYFPEDNGHDFVNDDKQVEETYFLFYDNESHLTINERNNGDIDALYDTFIYDENNLTFRTKLSDETNFYRVIIYTSGKFFFRPIGCSTEKKYTLHIVENKIVC